MVSTVYSQSTVITNKGDTLDCFSKEKTKFLYKQAFKLNECNEKLILQKSINDSLNKNLKDYKIIVHNDSTLIKNGNEKIGLKDVELKNKDLVIDLKNKEIKKQRAGKWIAIIVEGAIIVFVSYEAILNKK